MRRRDWKKGRLEDWKAGRLEDWKMGRLEVVANYSNGVEERDSQLQMKNFQVAKDFDFLYF